MRTEPRSGTDPFLIQGSPVEFSVGDFWQWGMSDLAINTIRAAVAEFLVSKALGCTGKVRDCWGGSDLKSPEGLRIEVKSAAYWQAWKQAKHSDIRFSIAPSRDWCAETNTSAKEAKRNADIYVFCLFNNQSDKEADLLELSHWEFYVLSAENLNAACLKQKSIALKKLLKFQPLKADFQSLHSVLKGTINQIPTE